LIGGVLGLLLLLLRFGTFESGMFHEMKQQAVSKGNFGMLFSDRKRLVKYLHCISIGLPVWFVLGVLVKMSPRFAAQIGVGEISIATSIMMAYLGLSVGDLFSGFLSQVLRSRRKVVLLYLGMMTVMMLIYLFAQGVSTTAFYAFMLGACTGYWALFVTIASEQFGTNIRATVTTTVPNFVRGAVIPIGLSFAFINTTTSSITVGALVVGGICLCLALFSILSLPETFGKDLDYTE
jgi:MFS transporter, putative metabolite:H+ symporter